MSLNCTLESGQKGMNKVNKKQMSGYHQGRGLGWANRVKGVNCMVIDSN